MQTDTSLLSRQPLESISDTTRPSGVYERPWTPTRFALLYISIMVLVYSVMVPFAGSLMGIYAFNRDNEAKFNHPPTFIVYFVWAGSWICTLPTSILGIIAFAKKQFSKIFHVWYIVGLSLTLLIHLAALITYTVLELVDASSRPPGSATAALAVIFLLVMFTVGVYTIALSLTLFLMKRHST
jgi:hypothetical protein